jgi:hypothetical protein
VLFLFCIYYSLVLNFIINLFKTLTSILDNSLDTNLDFPSQISVSAHQTAHLQPIVPYGGLDPHRSGALSLPQICYTRNL